LAQNIGLSSLHAPANICTVAPSRHADALEATEPDPAMLAQVNNSAIDNFLIALP
jgi:hypothetical protein